LRASASGTHFRLYLETVISKTSKTVIFKTVIFKIVISRRAESPRRQSVHDFLKTNGFFCQIE